MPAAKPEDDAWPLPRGTPPAHAFQTTLWTTVVAAGEPSSTQAQAALARLCQTYWRPVYAYIRRRTPTLEQAEDLTQSFFARLLEKNYLARADPKRGRFRSFLLTSVDNFLHDEHDRATSLKRGRGQFPLSLDIALASEEAEPVVTLTPAQVFERRWARSLLDQVMEQLGEECRALGRFPLFEHLQAHLWGQTRSIPYTQLAKDLAMSHVHLRVAAHRLRQRYREILREQIAQTVATADEIESEIRYLLQVVSG